jgi:hypothetical protein
VGEAVTAPALVMPWDQPWVHALKITKPMFVTLYDAERTSGVRMLYPGGQWRLIRAGLYRRGLIELDNRLTACGYVAARWAGIAVRRTWPDSNWGDA